MLQTLLPMLTVAWPTADANNRRPMVPVEQDSARDQIPAISQPEARTGSGSDPFRSLARPWNVVVTIHFSNLRVRPAMPKARFAPILPTTETGCNTVVRLDPPMRAFAPTPGPREISPLTPT
jgi:hypothetical protein